jgi:hypothetical protein
MPQTSPGQRETEVLRQTCRMVFHQKKNLAEWSLLYYLSLSNNKFMMRASQSLGHLNSGSSAFVRKMPFQARKISISNRTLQFLRHKGNIIISIDVEFFCPRVMR